MMDAITDDSYDLSPLSPRSPTTHGSHSPSITTQTEREEDNISIQFEPIPMSEIIEEPHVSCSLLLSLVDDRQSRPPIK